ncbi:hypothetical protein K493DRAFT_405244 [Basidiobolus meristosporus CBS 931.73]|uniref:Hydrophobin n=1 Tax=Basidiobolus meristosporus CBS 931.73 TaxID=1314790 RepID=A0A1Y1YWQ2_9FUNG|nr:hypothetical protein K493DRAFT_405244 [Basidiobolus meristosporus CBS 931.73]|eukprot:ORY02493.1 hypothetical protein K493DRAFT_405244 [Basidiobolus meristosporus CBS 931.73]
MRSFIAALSALLLATPLVQGGAITACINSNGVNCSERNCSVENCCNFQPDIKNNMASVRVNNRAGCHIFELSDCKGRAWAVEYTGKFVNLPAWLKNNNASLQCHGA